MASNWHYNEQNGQVYTETIVPVHSMVFTWMHRRTGAKQDPRRYRQDGPGAPSLYEMALRSCAWNIDLFTSEALQYAEWSYAGRIYRHLKYRNTLTANAWSLFETAFPTVEELDHTFDLRIPTPSPGELGSVQRWISSLSFSHLSFLNIQGLCLRRDDLMQLTNIPSLAVLVLRQSPFGAYDPYGDDINDKFMRDWGRAVQEKGAFTRLRTLVIHNIAASLAGILGGLAAFPILCLCGVQLVYAAHDIHDMEMGKVLDSLPWRRLPTSEREPENDPHLIWTRPDTTVHAKMKLLCELTSPFVQQPSNADLNAAILAIDCGSTSFRSSHDCSWFIRDLSSDEGPTQTTKRPKNGGKNRGANKKRKVREGKQKDVGSLLGAFG